MRPAALWLLNLILALAIPSSAQPYSLIITNVPAYGSTGRLEGAVSGTTPAGFRVAAFSYSPGGGWLSQPSCDEPLTAIQADGSWSLALSTDAALAATRFAVCLVSNNYSLPCPNGERFLTNQFTEALAKSVLTRPSPGMRQVAFNGYNWWVKSSSGKVGPGPNYFSDSTNNVCVDDSGRLHLKLTNRSNLWQCAELVSCRSFGYGSYRFELESRVDNLDPNVVLGLFTWSDDPAYAHREIDIECARWGNPADLSNAQYVVQPYEPAGHLKRFTVPVGLTNSTLCFNWETNRVTFQSLRGAYSPAPAAGQLIGGWTYLQATPVPGDENVRLNLWLSNNSGPSDHKEVEVIIKSFEFVPLETPKASRLLQLRRNSAGLIQFELAGEPDRRYRLERSETLREWFPLGILLATNFSLPLSDFVPAASATIFYRAVSMP